MSTTPSLMDCTNILAYTRPSAKLPHQRPRIETACHPEALSPACRVFGCALQLPGEKTVPHFVSCEAPVALSVRYGVFSYLEAICFFFFLFFFYRTIIDPSNLDTALSRSATASQASPWLFSFSLKLMRVFANPLLARISTLGM